MSPPKSISINFESDAQLEQQARASLEASKATLTLLEKRLEQLSKEQQASTTYIWVTDSFEGFHCWPSAPDDVAFLRNLHRHVFRVKVIARVSHGDRDIEFFQFKHALHRAILAVNHDLKLDPAMSCEMLAKEIYLALKDKDYSTIVSVEVSEDGENGAIYYV